MQHLEIVQQRLLHEQQRQRIIEQRIQDLNQKIAKISKSFLVVESEHEESLSERIIKVKECEVEDIQLENSESEEEEGLCGVDAGVMGEGNCVVPSVSAKAVAEIQSMPALPPRRHLEKRRVKVCLKKWGGMTSNPGFDKFGSHWSIQISDGEASYLHEICSDLVYDVAEDQMPDVGIASQVYEIDLAGRLDRELGEFMEIGKRFENGGYDAFTNNCQDFASEGLQILLERRWWNPVRFTDYQKVILSCVSMISTVVIGVGTAVLISHQEESSKSSKKK